MTKSAKTFTYNRLNLTSANQMHKDIAEFIENKKVLSYEVSNKFMNISVTIIVEEIEKSITFNKKEHSVLSKKDNYWGLSNKQIESFVNIDKKKTSKYRGVSWRTRDSKWRVELTARNKRHYLGQYDCEIEAANVYDRKALELLGSKAKLNFESEVVLNG